MRFSANLGLLWPERPLLDRIEAAARAGFRAVEMHWPYDVPASDVAATPNVKLQFDVYHVARAEGDVLVKLEKYRSYIGNIQIAGVPARGEPDDGEIAYLTIFAAIDGLKYTGWIGCEYRPRRDTDSGLSWMDRMGLR